MRRVKKLQTGGDDSISPENSTIEFRPMIQYCGSKSNGSLVNKDLLQQLNTSQPIHTQKQSMQNTSKVHIDTYNFRYADITPQLCNIKLNTNAKMLNDIITKNFNPDFNIQTFFKFNPSILKLSDTLILMSYRIYLGKIKGCKEYNLKKCHYWDDNWTTELWDNKQNLSFNYTGLCKIDITTNTVIEDTILIQQDKPSGFEDVRLFEHNGIVYGAGVAITAFSKIASQKSPTKKWIVARQLLETYGTKADILTKLPSTSLEIEYNCVNLHGSYLEKNWFGYTNKENKHIMINPSFGSFFPLHQSVVNFSEKLSVQNSEWMNGAVENFKNIPQFNCEVYKDIVNKEILSAINDNYKDILLKDTDLFMRLSGGSWGIEYDGNEILFVGHIVIYLKKLDKEKANKYIADNPTTQKAKNLINIFTPREYSHPLKMLYYQIFFTIDQVKNEITRISHAFNVFKSKELDTAINFPIGLAHVNNDYIISYGESDYKAVLLTLTKDEVDRLLTYDDPSEFKLLSYDSSNTLIDTTIPTTMKGGMRIYSKSQKTKRRNVKGRVTRKSKLNQ